MNYALRAFAAIALPLALLSAAFGMHQLLFSWLDAVYNLFNGIISAISGLLGHANAASAQQQFAQRLGLLQNNTANITTFYLSNAGKYKIPTNVSWAVLVTDQNSTNSSVIGRLTVVWNASSDTLHFYNGTFNTSISPEFAVRLTHSEFMSFSQAAATRDIYAALADYAEYWLGGQIKYTTIR